MYRSQPKIIGQFCAIFVCCGDILVFENCEFYNVCYQIEYVQVKTTNPKKYCVRPNTGVLLPRSTCDIIGYYDFFCCFSQSFYLCLVAEEIVNRYGI